MKALLVSFTHRGSRLSVKIGQILTRGQYTVEQYAMSKYCDLPNLRPIAPSLQKLVAQAFSECELIVFIGAVGIAVRAIAPFVKDKKTDPAVICIDELGQFTIPLLSGHIGGANKLARSLAQALDSLAVITTATDINNLPAIDEWATEHNLYIQDMQLAKLVSSCLLEGEAIGIINRSSWTIPLPDGFIQSTDTRLGVVLADHIGDSPYAQTLFLLPRNIYLGIGCRRDTGLESIEAFVLDKLRELDIEIGRVCTVASIDLKANEPGLLALASKYNWATAFYSAEELQRLEGRFSQSTFVQSITGVDNVCERAAVLASGGRLLMHKCSQNGVTLAIAVG